jgi:hypothetical protein
MGMLARSSSFSVILAAVLGGVVGAALVRGVPPVHAQIVPPKTIDYQIVPNDGLRFVSERNRLLMTVTNNLGSGALVLHDVDGRPAVIIEAGRSDARVVIRTANAGSRLAIESERLGSVGIAQQNGGNQIFANQRNDKEGFRAATGPLGGSLSIFGANGSPVASLEALAESGALRLRHENRATASLTGGKSGALILEDEAPGGAVRLSGRRIEIALDGKTVWEEPQP